MAKTSSQIKGDKIKKAIANKGKTNFEKAFEKSSLSKSPTPAKTTSANTGDGGGFKENLDYVAGVASRAAEKASELRKQEKDSDSNSRNNLQTRQINADRKNRQDAYSNAREQQVFNANNVREQQAFNANNAKQMQDKQLDYTRSRDFLNDAQQESSRQSQSKQSQEERALRAGQFAAQIQSQRNNQLLNLARGGL